MVTITGTVTDAAGASAPWSATATQGSSYPDGSAGAPPGTPQLPSLLNGYVARPPWQVAGVDYHVGIDRTLYPNLKDPVPGGVIASALASIGGALSTNRITFSGAAANNCVIDGYDFSLRSVSLQFASCSNPTVRNCNFVVPTDSQAGSILFLASVGGANVTQCEIDGNNKGLVGYGLIESNASGTTTVQYCYLHNAPAEAIVYGTTSAPAIHDTAFNLVRDTLGNRSGYHGDWVQEVSSSGQKTTSTTYRFNTWVVDITGTSTQGLSIFSANMAQGECDGVTVNNNTMVSASATFNQPNWGILCNGTFVNGNVTVKDNYVDKTGNNGGFLFFGSGGTNGPYTPHLVESGNINMVTGGALT